VEVDFWFFPIVAEGDKIQQLVQILCHHLSKLQSAVDFSLYRAQVGDLRCCIQRLVQTLYHLRKTSLKDDDCHHLVDLLCQMQIQHHWLGE
jgi:hypothetical protein